MTAQTSRSAVDQKKMLSQLNVEVVGLQQKKMEMEGLVENVHRKLKNSTFPRGTLRKDEKQLNQHLNVLQEENQQLRAQMLSLTVVFDKLQRTTR